VSSDRAPDNPCLGKPFDFSLRCSQAEAR